MKTQQQQASVRKLPGTTYYVLDAQGKSQLRLVKTQQRQTSVRKLPGTMSVYQHALDNVSQVITFAQTEKHIYGSSRLGTNTEKVPMFGSQNNTYSIANVRHRMGDRSYELTNHLGNVLSIISDKVIPHNNGGTPDYWLADIRQSTDYSPFGVILKNRDLKLTTGAGGIIPYRYGFQNQEMDDEIKGPGNSLNYTYRMHDPRLGRFFAVDPLAKRFPYYSTYQFSGNCVIAFIELEGNEPGIIFPSTVEFNTLKTNEQTITQNWRAIQAHNWADMAAELKKLKATDVNIKIEYVYIQTHGNIGCFVGGPYRDDTQEEIANFKVTDDRGTSITAWDLKEYKKNVAKIGVAKYRRLYGKEKVFETDEKGRRIESTAADWADHTGTAIEEFLGVMAELPDNSTVVMGACLLGNGEETLKLLFELTGKRLNFIANKSTTTPPGANLLDTQLQGCGVSQGWVKIGASTNGEVKNVTGTEAQGYIQLNSSGEQPLGISTEARPCNGE